jgi:peptidoglycan/LPS O-acetylase OafA/YrhL
VLILLTYDVLHGHVGNIDLKYFLFSQNLFSSHPIFFREAWSLCIEEWFYLLFPLIFYILLKIFKNKKMSFLITTSFFLILPLILRYLKYKNGIDVTHWDENYRKIVVLRLDSLMYGILASYFFHYKNELWNQIKYISLFFALAIIILLTFYYRHTPNNYFFLDVYYYNLESIAVFLTLPYFSELKKNNSRSLTFFFTFVSIISYSMYLLNFSLISGCIIPKTISLFGLSNDLTVITYGLKYFLFWFYLILGSYFMNVFFEKPIMNVRDKIRF